MYTPEMDTLTDDELDDLALQQVVGGIDLRLPTSPRFTPTLPTIPEEGPKVKGSGFSTTGAIVGSIVYSIHH
jgi:hypothetical protein